MCPLEVPLYRVILPLHCRLVHWESVLCSERPLSEVSLYTYQLVVEAREVQVEVVSWTS